MGEKQDESFQLSFHVSLTVDFQGSTGHFGRRSDFEARWTSAWVWAISSPSI
jgi:hypothetical protein